MIGAGVSIATIATRRRGANQAPPGAPIPTAAPVITGTPTRGQTLAVSNGTWTNNPTGYAYQWRRGGAAIAGATARTYELAAADVGATVSCTVTASNAAGSNYANAAAVGPVAAPAAPTVFRDSFDRADANLEAGANWTRASGAAGAMRVAGNQVATLAQEASYQSPDLGNADQYTQHVATGGGSVGPFIANRITDQDNWGAAVRYNVNTGAGQLWKRAGGTLTQYGSTAGSPCVVGATIRVETVGDTAQLVVNGVVVAGPYAMAGAGAGITRQGYVSRTNANSPWGDNYEAGHLPALTA